MNSQTAVHPLGDRIGLCEYWHSARRKCAEDATLRIEDGYTSILACARHRAKLVRSLWLERRRRIIDSRPTTPRVQAALLTEITEATDAGGWWLQEIYTSPGSGVERDKRSVNGELRTLHALEERGLIERVSLPYGGLGWRKAAEDLEEERSS